MRTSAYAFLSCAMVSCTDPAEQPRPRPGAVTESALSWDPSLRVEPEQHLVLNLESNDADPSPGDTGEGGRDEVRLGFVDPAPHTFCFTDDDGEEHGFELIPETGSAPIVSIVAGGPCQEINLPPGTYRGVFRHARAGGEDPSRDVVFTRLRRVQHPKGGSGDGPSRAFETRMEFDIETNRCLGCDFSHTVFDPGGFKTKLGQASHLPESLLPASFLPVSLAQTTTTGCPSAAAGQVYQNVDVTGASFFLADLEGACFVGSQVSGADFSYADLTSAYFGGTTNIQGAKLYRATLVGTVFDGSGVNAQGIELTGATLQATSFAGVDLTGAFARSDRPPVVNLGPNGEMVNLRRATVPWPLFSFSDLPKLARQQGTYLQTPTSLAGLVFDGLDLTQVNFNFPEAADLSGTSWKGTQLTEVGFQKTNLTNAHFDDANITSAHFDSTNLAGAKLPSASGKNASFSNAILTGADLTGADFGGATAVYADFSNATLDDAKFDTAGVTSLSGATFTNAKLRNTRLSNADLSYTSFTGASTVMTGAVLVQSNLTAADLSYVDLTGIQAQGASLDGANLVGANLTNAQFTKSDVGRATTLVRANFCGATLASTDFSAASLASAGFPQTASTVPGPNGPIPCAAVDLSSVKTTADTVCPNGNKPANLAACAGGEWVPISPPAVVCCTVPPAGGFCPPRKKPGAACTTDCDCRSQRCTGGTCA